MSFLKTLLLVVFCQRHFSDDDDESWDYSDPVLFSSVDPVSDLFSSPEEAELVCSQKRRRTGDDRYHVQPVYFRNCDFLFYVVIFA